MRLPRLRLQVVRGDPGVTEPKPGAEGSTQGTLAGGKIPQPFVFVGFLERHTSRAFRVVLPSPIQLVVLFVEEHTSESCGMRTLDSSEVLLETCRWSVVTLYFPGDSLT